MFLDVEVKGSEKIQKITPLICAAKFNAVESCRELIRSRANVNVKDCYGQTALHHATRRTHHKVVGVSVNNKYSLKSQQYIVKYFCDQTSKP